MLSMVRRLFLLLFFLPALAGCSYIELPTSQLLEALRLNAAPDLKQDLSKHNLRPGMPAFLRVFKEESVLETWLYDIHAGEYRLFRTYPICAYSGNLGPKRREGDMQSPEGFYAIKADQLNPWSKYHLSMNIGFPNKFDQAYGLTGTHLMVHGACKSEGCYAMGDPAIEEIYLIVEAALRNHPHGNVPIHIFPFRMTQDNMDRHKRSRWRLYWQNLKQGYDLFEEHKIPPRVSVDTGQGVPKYVFHGAR